MKTAETLAPKAEGEEVMIEGLIGTVVELPPDQFVVEDVLNVRPDECVDERAEQESIEELALSLREEGQIQDAACYPKLGEDGTVEYRLFIGNRRRTAIAWGNANLKGKPMVLRARVMSEQDAAKLRRKAIHENIKRRNLSAMQLARVIERARKDEGWEGGKDTKNVAKYFGVSVAQITQHEKLLALPPDVQARAAKWSADPAQFLATQVEEEKRAEVAERAQELAEVEADTNEKRRSIARPGGGTGSGKPRGKAVPQKKHVQQAAREKEALKTEQPRNRKELLDHFSEIAGSPVYGNANSPIRTWANFFVEKFATGKAKTDKGLLTFFDAMVMDEDNVPYAGEGTPSKADKPVEEKAPAKPVTVKKAGGKAVGKAAGKAVSKAKAKAA
jgi:ParB/RepB/Spo0J family partition protein